jgi:uncharacterized membrane protein SirB2
MKTLLLISALVGIACGELSTHTFIAGTWWNLLFWAAAGIVLGYFALSRKEILWNGAIFGFCLTIAFLFSGFEGTIDKLPSFALLSLGLSVVGILGGVATLFVGSWLRARFFAS